MDYDVSDSGYYLDELEGLTLNMVGVITDCEQGGVWDIMTKARENAIKDFKGDLLSQLGSQYKKTLENLTYTIGSQKYSEVFNPGTTYAGVKLIPRSIRNGIVRLNHVKLMFNATVVVQCRLFNNLSPTPIHSFTVNCTANTASQSAALNYELPMYESGDELEYYLVYELPVTARPLKNKIICSTCLNWAPKCCSGCFGTRTVKDQTWNNNLMVGGIYGNTWEALENSPTTENQNYGIILNLNMACDYEQIICDNADYEFNGPGKAIAKAIQYKAGANLIDYILSSDSVSRYALMDRERLMSLKPEFIAQYNSRVVYLSQNLDGLIGGCYYCEPRSFYMGIKA